MTLTSLTLITSALPLWHSFPLPRALAIALPPLPVRLGCTAQWRKYVGGRGASPHTSPLPPKRRPGGALCAALSLRHRLATSTTGPSLSALLRSLAARWPRSRLCRAAAGRCESGVKGGGAHRPHRAHGKLSLPPPSGNDFYRALGEAEAEVTLAAWDAPRSATALG